MRVLTPGHKYRLQGKGVFSNTQQDLQFVCRDTEGNLLPGITNEEVLTVLIDRLYHQQKGRHSEATSQAIKLLKQAKRSLSVREKTKYGKNPIEEEF